MKAFQEYLWYSLDDPGWRFSGLLDAAGAPRPSYLAYQVLAQQLIKSEYLAPVADYGTNVEAYAFTTETRLYMWYGPSWM